MTRGVGMSGAVKKWGKGGRGVSGGGEVPFSTPPRLSFPRAFRAFRSEKNCLLRFGFPWRDQRNGSRRNGVIFWRCFFDTQLFRGIYCTTVVERKCMRDDRG